MHMSNIASQVDMISIYVYDTRVTYAYSFGIDVYTYTSTFGVTVEDGTVSCIKP